MAKAVNGDPAKDDEAKKALEHAEAAYGRLMYWCSGAPLRNLDLETIRTINNALIAMMANNTRVHRRLNLQEQVRHDQSVKSMSNKTRNEVKELKERLTALEAAGGASR